MAISTSHKKTENGVIKLSSVFWCGEDGVFELINSDKEMSLSGSDLRQGEMHRLNKLISVQLNVEVMVHHKALTELASFEESM